MFFGNLQEKVNILERNKRIAVVCSLGKRSSIAASILKRNGFSEVYNVLGGMAAWMNLGFSVKKE
jgi:hydroxyacylglutathione hydrolase